MTTAIYCWIAAVIAFSVLEGLTVALVSVWFIGGSIAGLVAAACGASVGLQLGIFVAVSAILLALLRPLAKKYISPRREHTNADRLVGREALVTEPIDNLRSSGAVRVDGVEWTARSQSGAAIDAGTRVKILRIEGVKVFVQPVEETAPAASGVS